MPNPLARALRRWYGLTAVNLFLALSYAALGAAALRIVDGTGLASPVWPSAGLAFAFVLQYGARLVPGVMVGSFVVNALALHSEGHSWQTASAVACVIALGAGLQALFARFLVHRWVGRHLSLVGPGQILRFLALAGPAASVVNASVGLAAQSWSHIIGPIPLQVWITWWVGDSIGSVMFGPLVLMMLAEQGEVWRDRRLKVALPALVAVLVAVAVFLQGSRLSRDRADAELRARADLAWHTLADTMRVNNEILEGVRGLHLASERVHCDEFRVYTANLLQQSPFLQALSWNPVLTKEQLESFVREMRSTEGLQEYRVTEKDASGAFVPVGNRERYVVVGFIEPMSTNAKALGYDIGSDVVRSAAIDRAIEMGQAAATAPVVLVQESGQQFGFLVLLPIFSDLETPETAAERRATVRGFAVGVYRATDLLRTAFSDGTWATVDLRLTDVTSPGTPLPMAQVLSRAEGIRSERLHRYIPAAGRTWRLDVTVVQPAETTTQLVNEPAILLLGLLIAMLLMAFLLLTSGFERQARREASVDPLTGLDNRRSLLVQLEKARRLAQTMRTTHVLLFMDLDRFKLVNDTGGHAVGDRMLIEIGTLLKGAIRERDTVARMGGDEFAVLLLDCGEERGRAIATEIIASIRDHAIDCNGTPVVVGVSIGMAIITPPDPEEVPELLRRADRASYVAKFAGGNRVIAHDPASRGVH